MGTTAWSSVLCACALHVTRHHTTQEQQCDYDSQSQCPLSKIPLICSRRQSLAQVELADGCQGDGHRGRWRCGFLYWQGEACSIATANCDFETHTLLLWLQGRLEITAISETKKGKYSVAMTRYV